MDGEELKSVFRELFEAQVINHGDYSLVYAQRTGPGPGWVLGYRRTPLELVLCPVDLQGLLLSTGVGPRDAARFRASASSLSLANVATVADTGTGYQLQSVTGVRTCFEVEAASGVCVGAAAAGSVNGTVVLDQEQDAEDFHEFMGLFMDTLDAFYQVPDTAAFAPPLATSH